MRRFFKIFGGVDCLALGLSGTDEKSSGRACREPCNKEGDRENL